MSELLPRTVRGVAAVVVREGKLLVIERSQLVRAPGMFCFPGGAIEAGESESAAIVRELLEELSLAASAARPLWNCVTPWGVSLSWWLAQIDEQAIPQPNPAEVASYHWLTVTEIRQLPNLLASNHEFLSALESGAITIDGLEPGSKTTASETAD